ncbi:P2X purinoceptor 4-like [Saccostrea cucullata]|uniref:P2X purinoceptor 4-like n=1 Tax=Saccostrea cuccullata TaxID=36930 RepID=UPI002ED136BE
MKYISAAISVFFEYDTPRIVHIKSKKVGVINRFIQLCIIGYVIGYAIIFKKGYQDFDNVQSVVTTKVKGIVMVDESIHPDIQRIWDVADYIVPPQENNAFFVVTNLIVTPFQSIGKCPEDESIKGSNCTSNADCKNGTVLPVGNVLYFRPKPAILENSKDFTVFIKNNIEFPKYNVKRRNLPDNVSDEYLQNCRYDGGPNSRCPIFTLQSIVEGANSGSYRDVAAENRRRNVLGFQSNEELSKCRYNLDDPVLKYCPIFVLSDIVNLAGGRYEELASEGGVIQVKIKWNCNLDLSEDKCLPEYSFRRLDSSTYKISKGYNFRYSKNFKFENGTEYRTLYKAYGIKFVISVSGQGRKFAPVPFLTNIGSGLALLSIATVICDIVVLYVLKARHIYKEKKYLEVVGDDAYKGFVNDDERSRPNYQSTSDNDL